MPTQSQQNILTASWFGQRVRKNGAIATTGESGSAPRGRIRITGENLPNYKWYIANGYNATTSLTGTDYVFNPCYFRFVADLVSPPPSDPSVGSTTTIFRSIEGTSLDWPPLSPWGAADISESNADNRAKAKFVKKAVSLRRSLQGGVFLGELRQTIAAVRNPARSLRSGLDDYVSALKKRRPQLRSVPPSKRRKTATQIAADTWLEHSFGWLPLISDVKSGAEALAKSRIESNRPKTVFVSATGEDAHHRTYAFGQNSAFNLVVTRLAAENTSYSVKYY